MSENKVLFTGEKESFITRVLIKKIKEAGVDCSFVPWTINDINSNINSAAMIVLFMEDGENPGADILHYLSDTMDEKAMRMVVIGEQYDIQRVIDRMPGELIYKTFTRPVDNAVFVSTVKEYFDKAESGNFRKSILVVDDDPQYLTMVRE